MTAPTPKTIPTTAAIKSIKPPSILLMGPPGSGKTFSVTTLLEAGLELFVLITEPNGLDTLFDSCSQRKLSIDKLHWKYVSPASPDLDALIDMGKKVGTLSYADLSNLKGGISKTKTQQWMDLLYTLKDFVDDKDGRSYGSVFDFDDTRAFVNDSLSGWNSMAKDLMVGLKPTAAEGEWGVSMNLIEKLLQKCCSDLNCFFVMTAHVEKQTNLITNASEIMVSTLGKKLAPKIGKDFSEIVVAKRGKDKSTFLWSTAETQMDLKNRALPISDTLKPSFVPIVEVHRRRVAQAKEQ